MLFDIAKLDSDFEKKGFATQEFSLEDDNNNPIIDVEAIHVQSVNKSTHHGIPMHNNTHHSDCKSIKDSINKLKTIPRIVHKKYKPKYIFCTKLFISIVSNVSDSNTTNIQGIEDNTLRQYIFRYILEREASIQLSSNYILKELNNSFFEGQCVQIHTTSDGIKWRIGCKFSGTSFGQLFKVIFSCSSSDAYEILAKVLKVSQDYLYTATRSPHTIVGKHVQIYTDMIPHIIQIENDVLCYQECIIINGPLNQVIGAFARYTFNDTSICIPVSIVKNHLTIGLCQPTALLLNQEDIDNHPDSTVIFCQDIRTAIALDKIVRDSKELAPNKYIISGHTYCDINELPLSYFDGHDVILLPAPNTELYGLIEVYEKNSIKAGANSFRIYPFWILHADSPDNKEIHPLLQQARYIGDIDRVSLVIRDIEKNSMPLEEFILWGQKEGLLVIPSNNKTDNIPLAIESEPASKIVCTKLADVNYIQRDYDLPVNISDFLNYNFVTLLWGSSDVGKSWVAIQTMICFILGLPMFFLASSTFPSKRRVAYIDGEIGEAILKQRIEQICKSLGVVWSDIEEYIDIISLNGKSLLDENVQEEILSLSISNMWKLVINDNIQACAPEACKGRSTALSSLTTRLKNNGCGTLMVHHANKDGDNFKGDGALADLAQNILRLECAPSSNINKSHKVKSDAILTKMTVTKCKVDGNRLKNKSAIYQLPIGGAWEYIEGELPHFETLAASTALPSEETDALKNMQPLDRHEDFIKSLSPKHEKLYLFMKQNKKFIREDVEKHFDVCSKTASNYLKMFVENSIITLHGGKGDKDTYYTFND